MAQKNSKILKLTECSIMLALSIVLSFVTIYKMPMGGSVTLLSMLPVMLLGLKYGLGTGVCTAFMFAVFQLAYGFFSGDVFVYCVTPLMVVICILFDYLVPYTLLGFTGIFRKACAKREEKKTANYVLILAGFIVIIALRFLCHFITGVSIWGQFAPEGQTKIAYSLIYNIQYMLPECIITTIGAAILLKIPPIKKILGTDKFC